MLGRGVRAVPSCQQHDSYPFEGIGDRRVVIKIALYYLYAFWGCEFGRIAHKGADFDAGYCKGIQCRASDLARRRHNKYHDTISSFRALPGFWTRGRDLGSHRPCSADRLDSRAGDACVSLPITAANADASDTLALDDNREPAL